MDIGGYAMGQNSKLRNFSTFALYFASPWIIWVILVYFTAIKCKFAFHKYIGNMMLKGCIAVPMARVSGAFLQRYGWKTAEGYYVGILGSSILVGIWVVYETIVILKASKKD